MLFILKTIIRRRKFVLASGLLTAAVAVVVSLFLPKWYTAHTSVFPPETRSAMSGYMQVLQQSLQIPIFGPSAVGARPNTIYIDVMLSRRVGERVVEEFDLKRVYKTALMSETIDVLHSHTFFSLLENGLLNVSFEDQDPEQAAAITNRYIELLDGFNREANVTRASKTKEFIAGQLELHEEALEQAEEALREFQEVHETLKLDEQITAAIEIVADLTAEAVALEIDLEILRHYTSQASEEYTRKKKEHDEILNQLTMFKADSARAEDDQVRSFFPTFDAVPRVGLDLARLIRRVKIEEAVYGLLIEQYEKSRIEEAKDTPTVQVLDRAEVPERRSRPSRKTLVIVGGILGLAWSSLFAILLAVWREDKQRVQTLRELVRPFASDFERIYRRKKIE